MGVLTFKDRELPTDKNVKDDVFNLVINNAQKMHSGIYTCKGEDSEISHFTEDVQLSVRGKCFICP